MERRKLKKNKKTWGNGVLDISKRNKRLFKGGKVMQENIKMQLLVQNSKNNELTEIDKIKLEEMLENFFLYKDCIVSNIYQKSYKKHYKNLRSLGYRNIEIEYEMNEITVLDLVNLDTNNAGVIKEVFKVVKANLKEKFPNRTICIIFIWNEEEPRFSQFRIHTYSKEEGLYIDENIESYDEPIMYEIFG